MDETTQRRRSRRWLHRNAPVVVEVGPWGLWAREATWRERVLARVRAHRLDQWLAEGRSPESFPLLSLRAQRLARPSTRQRLAASLRSLLRQSDHPPMRLGGGPLADLASIREMHREIVALADQLDAPVPVSAHGVALVADLLEDGRSPLYRRQQGRALRAWVRAATVALDPADDWPADL
jgi:hypothetical protein